jgi:hypothetical protein
MKEIQKIDSLNMISISENDLKSVKDILISILESQQNLHKTMLEIRESNQNFFKEISEDNRNFGKKLDEFHLNIENEIDSAVETKLGQNIEDSNVVTDEISSKEAELDEKFGKLADDMDGEVNDMIQEVQVEDNNCTEEILKRQGEKAAQLNVKTKNLHG